MISLKVKLYNFLSVLFAVIIVVSNLTYQKFIYLDLVFYQTVLSVGVILYPITFVISDLVTEFFGKANAVHIVRIGIMMNIICILIINIFSNLKATEWSKIDDYLFNEIFSHYGVAVFASIIACYFSQNLDIVIYNKIKIITKNKFLILRNFVSTSISLFFDSLIVISILVFFKKLPRDKFFEILAGSYSYKFLCSIIIVPVFYYLVVFIKKYIFNDKEFS